AMDNMKAIYVANERLQYVNSPYEAAKGAHALLILTEWEEFKQLDLKEIKQKMETPIIVDGRNIYDPTNMKNLGFEYFCIGR
ncbi:MAG TPA: UDP-glucose 6-dehydrogenase, partial [Candidatus Atribacteria bacterium]|nr:UDP-glucose 6-dehydrogenase [Candidatus Atribacteria bacterium]